MRQNSVESVIAEAIYDHFAAEDSNNAIETLTYDVTGETDNERVEQISRRGSFHTGSAGNGYDHIILHNVAQRTALLANNNTIHDL